PDTDSISSFFFSRPPHLPRLHSFPTRRSSDLKQAILRILAPPPFLIWGGAVWGLATSAFVHLAWWHILFNMLCARDFGRAVEPEDRKSTRLNSSHLGISYAVFCLKKKKKQILN